MPVIDQSILQPGDHILYRPSSFTGLIIAVKTWSWVSHIEVVVSVNPYTSIAARSPWDGNVNQFALRNDKYVAYVLRPEPDAGQRLDINKGMEWFNREAKGDKYDLGGLFGFYIPGTTKPRKDQNYHSEFCSMLAVLFDQACGFLPFNPNYPAKKVSPAQFLQSPEFTQAYPVCVSAKSSDAINR
jgi:hypothetical protein